MKQITTKVSVFLAFIYVFAMVFSSCSTSESVVSNNFLQKRKYNKGFHKTGKTKVKTNKTENEEVFVLNHSTIKELEIVPTKENTQKEVTVSNVSDLNTNEVVTVETVNSSVNISEEENEEVTKSKLAQTVENKVEKVASALKKGTIVSNSSNTSSTTGDDMMILLIILAILIPFVAVGIYTDWDLTKTLICLLLCILFYLPGMIYALLTIFDKI